MINFFVFFLRGDKIRSPLFTIFQNFILFLPTPSNITIIWNFGSLLGVCLIVEMLNFLLTGIQHSGDILVYFYICFLDLVFFILSSTSNYSHSYYSGRRGAQKRFCRLCERNCYSPCKGLNLRGYPNLVPQYHIYWIRCRGHLKRGYDFSYEICGIYRGLSSNNLVIKSYRRQVVLNGTEFTLIYHETPGNILISRFLEVTCDLDKSGKFKFLLHIPTPEQGGCYLLHGQSTFGMLTYSEFKRLSYFLLLRGLTPQEVSLLGSLVILEKFNIIEKGPAKLVTCLKCGTKYFSKRLCLVCLKIPQ